MTKLPSRWRFKHGAYYYRVPVQARDHWDGKTEYRLGKTLAEAHATFASKLGYEPAVYTMADLCDRYEKEVIPHKAPATQISNGYSLRRIRKVLGKNPVSIVDPQGLYAYRDLIGRKESHKKANLDLEVLSHMFTKSIEWGLRDDHPMTNKRVVKYKLEHRKVLPTTEEVAQFAAGLPIQLQLYVALKVWTGRRKGELLRLRRDDLTEAGMVFTDNKRGDQLLVPWEPATRAIVQQLLQLSGGVSSLYVFHTRKGQPYIKEDGSTQGFNAMWQRYAKRWREAGGKHFTEHDLRKVRASQMSSQQAQAFLNHATGSTTKRYQLGPKVLNLWDSVPQMGKS